MTPENPERELSSWKEVAAHLGVSVRTAQDWERTRGMPVRRTPGPRGRIRAIAAELDRWKDGTPVVAAEPAPEAPAADLVQRAWWRSWWAAAGLVAIAAITSGFWWLRPGPPVSYRVEPGRLITLDHRGREVWRKDFPDLRGLPAGLSARSRSRRRSTDAHPAGAVGAVARSGAAGDSALAETRAPSTRRVENPSARGVPAQMPVGSKGRPEADATLLLIASWPAGG